MSQKREKEVSMFAYYVSAARVAATLGISLGYAFDRYVKPHIPEGSSPLPFTDEEWREINNATTVRRFSTSAGIAARGRK